MKSNVWFIGMRKIRKDFLHIFSRQKRSWQISSSAWIICYLLVQDASLGFTRFLLLLVMCLHCKWAREDELDKSKITGQVEIRYKWIVSCLSSLSSPRSLFTLSLSLSLELIWGLRSVTCLALPLSLSRLFFSVCIARFTAGMQCNTIKCDVKRVNDDLKTKKTKKSSRRSVCRWYLFRTKGRDRCCALYSMNVQTEQLSCLCTMR